MLTPLVKIAHFGNRNHTTLTYNKKGMWFHSKGHILSQRLHFLPYSCENICRELRLMLPDTYEEIYDNHACHIVQKHVKMSVYKKILERQCQISALWGSIYSETKLAGSSFFQNTGVAGSGAYNPWRELEGSALDRSPLLFCGVSRLISEFMQQYYHQKASVKIQHLEGKIQIIPWQGVCFVFTNTVSQKSQTHIVVMKNMVNNLI